MIRRIESGSLIIWLLAILFYKNDCGLNIVGEALLWSLRHIVVFLRLKTRPRKLVNIKLANIKQFCKLQTSSLLLTYKMPSSLIKSPSSFHELLLSLINIVALHCKILYLQSLSRIAQRCKRKQIMLRKS